MKTITNLSLTLQKLCNQSDATTNWRKSKWLVTCLLLFTLIMLPLQQVKADYFYEYQNYFNVNPNPDNKFGAIDIHFIGLDRNGDNDRMSYVFVAYSIDDGKNWVSICNYQVIDQNLTKKFIPTASTNKNIVNNYGFIIDKGIKYGDITPDQAYVDLTWYYPAHLKGKNITIGLFGIWQRNYATSNPTSDELKPSDNPLYYRRDVPAPIFDPKPTLTFAPKEDGKYNLSWKSAGEYLTKFDLYSINNTLLGSVANTSSAGDGSLKLGLFNTTNTYNVNQIYLTPSDVSGFSVAYEKSVGTVKHTGYSHPKFESATFDACTNKTTLKWVNTLPTNYDQNSKLYIFRKRGNQKYYTQLNFIGLANNLTDYTYQEELLMDSTYSYIIRTYPNSFDISNSNLTSENADSFLPELLSKIILKTERKTINFDGFTASAIKAEGTNKAKILVKWVENWCTDNSKTIKINRYNTNDKTKNVFVVQSKDLKYEDFEIGNDIPYHYQLEVDNSGVTVYSPWDSINNVISDYAQIEKLTTTKGVYNDRIKLLWEIDKPTLNKKFIVRRKVFGDNEYVPIYEKESQNKIENWEDLSVSPGILYQYQVESYYVTPTLKIVRSYSSDTLGLGFCQPSATVSGNITYGSGTAVENVNVSIENNDLTQQLYSSINFIDQDTKRGEGNITFNKLKHGCIHTGFTWQAWIKPQNRTQDNAILYELKDEYSIRINNNEIEIYNGSATTSTKVLSAGISDVSTSEFFQITVAYNPTTKNFEIYINGVLKNSAIFNTPACSNPETAAAKVAASFNTQLNHFKGSIDEMRLWNRRLTPDEVLKNFNRYISGTETDLVGYWQMDEGIDMYAFDRSNKSKTYNEHHIKFSNASTSATVPTTSQLSIKATTDKNGNYIIQGVPYKGNGSSYHVTPIYGTHTFQPSSQLIFIGGASSEVQSAVSFKDISSFTITGEILYENTNYPVEDVEFLVDGNVCMRNYKKQVTNADGRYEIDVPIGEHIITPVKNGHVFADADADVSLKMGLKYNFNVNMTNVDFADKTKVSLVGRVTGGKVQEAMPIGFNRSKANIGPALVVLQTKQNGKYTLNKSINDSLAYDVSDKDIKSTAKVKKGEDFIRIITDPDNGEFSLQVPPVPMIVTSVTAGSLTNVDFKYGNLPAIHMNPLLSSVDTIHSGTKVVDGITVTVVDSCKYHQKMNITYIVPKAEFIISDKNYTWKAFGDSLFNYVDPNNSENDKTVSLVTRNDNGSPKYLIGSPACPVFTQGNCYIFDIVAYEKYINPVTKLNDLVYLKNASFSIENKLSNKPEKTFYSLDSLGRYTYKFMAGNPNIISPYSKGMTASIEHNYAVEAWTETLNGIVLGAVPVGGVDFITKGPDQVIAVLRDPPGSNSYATLDKGSSVSQTKSYKGIGKESSGHKFIANLGGAVEFTLGAFGVATTIKTENKYDIGAGIEQSVVVSDATSRNESFSFSESISTSSSPDYIGASGDLYIANSSNIGFAKCDQLSLNSNGGIQLGQSYIFVPMGDTTSVRYTQDHIVNTLLPKIKNLRNSLLDTNTPNYTRGTWSKYYSTKQKNEVGFGENGNYIWVRPAIVETVCIDSVKFYNNQIRNWEKLIRDNEIEKLYVAGKSPVGNTSTIKYNSKNISFDAGAILSNSYSRTSSCTQTSNVTWELQAVFSADLGLTVNEFGFSVENEVKSGGGEEKTTEDLIKNTITYSYNLKDGDAGNYFSVDVFTPKSYTVIPKAKVNMNNAVASYAVSDVEHEGGPIFITRGGNSSCPYEGEDMSLFYKNLSGNSVALNTATVQIEKPGINVLVPSVAGIASGKQATYDVELQNYSETTTSCWFKLSVDPATNPRGAIINIDGTPLTEPRLFLIPAKQQIKKTIRLSQSSTDDLNFDNIKLVFESPCDTSIKSKAFISASFIPSCSDITMEIEKRIVNTNTGPGLNIVLKDFDKSYKNFAGIVLQYKGVNELNWRLAKEFVLDIDAMKPSTGFIQIGSNATRINYEFPMKDELDQTYQFRARTVCKGDVYNETPVITIIKDMKTPKSMGLPSPSNGIMTPESDVSVTFNEKIQTEKIATDDVTVYGILNDFEQDDNVGLQFNGAQKAYTESALNLQNGFTIEGKVLVSSGNTEGIIFTLGEGANKISLLAVSSGLKVLVGSNYSKTVTLNPDDQFQYVALTYDASSMYLSLMLWSNKNNYSDPLFSEKYENGITATGRLILGENFKGKLRQFSIWSEARTHDIISRERAKSRSGNEMNLAGYWPMDEGTGTLAVDKARSRNLIVNSSWYIVPGGLAALLNKTNQVLVKSHHIPVTKNEDFGVEFWFMGSANQPNTSLLSCTNQSDSVGDLQIGFNGEGNLAVQTMKNAFVIPSGAVLDNKWHHFALSVMRNGNAQVYIDGAMKYQTSATNFGAMASDSIAFGAKRNFAKGASVATINQRFEGSLDEIRLWRCALTGENIRLNKNSKINGNELGLIAYYPFDRKNLSNNVVFDDADRYTPVDTLLVNGGKFKGLSVTDFDNNTPPIKPARKRVKVLSNFTASDNKLVINIDEDAARIENCILEFEVGRVMDLNENRLASALKWTAYVDMNRLKWESTALSITKEVLSPKIFTGIIINNSGKYEDFVISGIPSWLSVNKTQGTLNPLEKTTLTFTVDQSLNIGSYECDIRVTGSKNIDEIFPVAIKVTGPRPDWTVNAYGYESTMNVMGEIILDSISQEDTEDILAAFNGTRCVGIANPIFNKKSNSYIVFMDIYGNGADNGKKLTYSLWDAGTGRIYPNIGVEADSAKTFIAGSIAGKVLDPIEFVATDKVEQQLSLKQGWTWVSTNVVNTNLLDQFKSGLEASGLQIKNKTGYIDYDNGDWLGYIEDINQRTMYLVNASEAKTIKLEGATAKPADLSSKITINKGWSYIGYVPQFVAPVKEALNGLAPKDGDQIKGQIGFATFDNKEWYGSLQYMTPGLGYMYKSAIETSFNYPAQYISQSRIVKQDETVESTKWAVDVNKYQMSMTITGIVSIDGLEVNNTDQQVAVFIGDECRGTAVLKYIESYNRYVAFLMVWGNTDDLNKKIIFRSFNASTNLEISAINESLSFVPDNITGSVSNPYKISFVSSGNASINDNDLKIYPNPTNNMLYFSYLPAEVQQVEVIDNVGRRLITFVEMNKNSINVGNLLPGIYTLRVKHNGIVSNHLFVKY